MKPYEIRKCDRKNLPGKPCPDQWAWPAAQYVQRTAAPVRDYCAVQLLVVGADHGVALLGIDALEAVRAVSLRPRARHQGVGVLAVEQHFAHQRLVGLALFLDGTGDLAIAAEMDIPARAGHPSIPARMTQQRLRRSQNAWAALQTPSIG
ncbi:hypothetical protein [Comamonas sp. SCN 65-56]|uniref:hypothetical protein n=1 Tax=Comamonas sp. SCN 65-56 TaxID=1660095 RepID=UPI0025C00314|nr:hypothetical protein [Comamonas sp. SCN 65-56]